MQSQFERPTPSSNQLLDVIQWLQNGSIVIIFNDYNVFRIFYQSDEYLNDLTNRRIIMIDCQSVPGICDDGEWNYYIKEAGNIESNSIDLLQKIRVMIGNKSPNVFRFRS